ncbi:McrB family protein [Capnocytophaga canis]|uniref:McrB family protein n=1 Tax=Capnocytophaga canis TaxID=1848903 RepID=UPI0038598395
MNEIVKFKHLLEYFVTHLEWCQNEDVNFIGYEKYIKNLVEKNKFRKAGQGYNDDKIQLQIKEWENYSIGKICINVSGYTPNRYISEFCYLNWLGTGINICAKWEDSKIKSLYLTEYRYWEHNTPRVNLETGYSLFELKLFEEGTSPELETFFDKYKNYFIQFKQVNNIQKTLDLLKYKKQIILQGPPGTGKTREAKELAKALLNLKKEEDLKNNDQFQIIQFHPSYSYEDFVRGIVAKPNSNGDGITYEAENKILAKFAKKALENYQNSQKDVQTLSEENKVLKYFEAFKDDLNDKIDENNGFNLTESVILLPLEDEDAFRYKGKGEIGWSQGKGLRMLHNDILQAHFDGNTSRQDIKKNQNLSGLARQHASYYVRVLNLFQKFIEDNPNLIKEEKPENDLKNFVLIIDEINRANLSSVLGELIYALEYRGEAVDSMYAIDGSNENNRSNKITLPSNLYIIGTMNTADRSVGHIDYAIRRRFAFVDMFPKDLSQELGGHFAKDKFIAVSELFIKDFDLNKDYSKEQIVKSEHLSSEFDAKDVWLGHSYFITKDIDIQTRLDYEIKPILREYVKDGVLKEETLEKINDLGKEQ